MLSVTQLSGFGTGAAGAGPELAFVGLVKSAAAAQNHTFNTTAIGAADPTRRVIFAVHTVNSVAFRTISSFTVDGVAITPAHITLDSSGFNGGHVAIFSVLKPTGTTADLQINTNGTNAHMTVQVFRAINETVATPHDTLTDNSMTGNTLSDTINVPGSGWVLAVANHFGATTAPTGVNWTAGVTEVSDDVVGTAVARASAAIQVGLPSETGRTVTSVNVGSTIGQLGAMTGMSWG